MRIFFVRRFSLQSKFIHLSYFLIKRQFYQSAARRLYRMLMNRNEKSRASFDLETLIEKFSNLILIINRLFSSVNQELTWMFFFRVYSFIELLITVLINYDYGVQLNIRLIELNHLAGSHNSMFDYKNLCCDFLLSYKLISTILPLNNSSLYPRDLVEEVCCTRSLLWGKY